MADKRQFRNCGGFSCGRLRTSIDAGDGGSVVRGDGQPASEAAAAAVMGRGPASRTSGCGSARKKVTSRQRRGQPRAGGCDPGVRPAAGVAAAAAGGVRESGGYEPAAAAATAATAATATAPEGGRRKTRGKSSGGQPAAVAEAVGNRQPAGSDGGGGGSGEVGASRQRRALRPAGRGNQAAAVAVTKAVRG